MEKKFRYLVPGDYMADPAAVSYTHLDVYKRQILYERGVFSVNPGPFASKSFPSKRCLATG